MEISISETMDFGCFVFVYSDIILGWDYHTNDDFCSRTMLFLKKVG